MLLTISLIKDANLYKPTILMHGLWTVIVFLNILELFGLKKSNDVVYELVIIGQIAFYIGHTLGNEGHTFTIYFKEKKVYKEKEINYKMVLYFRIYNYYLITYRYDYCSTVFA